MSDSPAPTDTPRCPALPPGIRAAAIANLLAAIPPPTDDPADRSSHAAMLGAALDELHPRDLEEAMLATQFLVPHHTAMRYFAEAARRKPGGRKASRLCRDALALQRAAQAALRALHKSQARPMLQLDLAAAPHPTVPTIAPKPPSAARPAEPSTASGKEVAAAPAPKPRKDPFEGHPDLRELSDRWETLPPWEQMTPEERRKTFGYKYTPKPAPATDAAPTVSV